MSLDDALQSWASQVALPETAADEIFREIVAAPPAARVRRRAAAPAPGVDPQWWKRFSTQLTSTIVISTRPRRVFT
ncbi:hypothetical protein [Actinoplanes sp. NBRC 103695]|uniref:hypothetical protein n=1 Tax=Actinoplanes sp. NBRC 103695 TaxID=3032202 RepID=UPI0024A4DB4A|nr:hypothetical protein [Actinoplanes sp. NBRC 103695]GLY96135.1 hypothetical protein Acsp02_33900 [Actinoplanes sp. NBRC 103695]